VRGIGVVTGERRGEEGGGGTGALTRFGSFDAARGRRKNGGR
jgi:hypothetical protein